MIRFDPNFSRLAAAFWWYTAGFSVIPVVPKTDLPAVDRDTWLGALSATAMASHWTQHPDHNVGCVLAQGLVVLEAGGPEMVEVLGELEAEFKVSPMLLLDTPRGQQHYFRYAAGANATPGTHEAEAGVGGIEFKTGRTVVLLPPCAGTTIRRCEIESTDDLVEIRDELIDAISRHRDGPRHTESVETNERQSGVDGHETGDPPKPATNPFACFSVSGQSEELQRQAVDQVQIFDGLALMGQCTLWYGGPNTGKTALSLRLAIETILNGTVDPAGLVYLNLDDTSQGLAEKARISEDYGFLMIAENYRGFRGSRLLDILTAAADKDQARGLVVIIDVIKKVTDPMSKRLSAAFGKGARQFVLRGGTIIALAHVNKHRTADDKPVFGGTSDLLDDFDAGYLMYQVSVDAVAQTKTITLENIKSRGDVARHASYRYSTAAGQSYRELLDSITAVDQSEASVAQRSEQMHTDADLIKIARESISAGIDTRMVLAAAIAQKSGCSKRKAFQLLDRHTGEDPQRHRWAFYVKARGAKTYRLLSPAVDDPEADA